MTVQLAATSAALLTMGDVARLAGVQPITIRKYRSLGRMPEPTTMLDGARNRFEVPVWSYEDIAPWLAARATRTADRTAAGRAVRLDKEGE